MHDSGDGRHLDAADVLFEIGRRTQAAALMMRKHQVLPTQQLCECGRVATRVVPAFFAATSLANTGISRGPR